LLFVNYIKFLSSQATMGNQSTKDEHVIITQQAQQAAHAEKVQQATATTQAAMVIAAIALALIVVYMLWNFCKNKVRKWAQADPAAPARNEGWRRSLQVLGRLPRSSHPAQPPPGYSSQNV
jgi:peptidoglycan/LPS O-acetylase OafA/YrhL